MPVRTSITLGIYAQYRVAKASQCMVLQEGTTPKESASAFINPLTALGISGLFRAGLECCQVAKSAGRNLTDLLPLPI
jgi:NADPH2:quinone reductase